MKMDTTKSTDEFYKEKRILYLINIDHNNNTNLLQTFGAQIFLKPGFHLLEV